MHLWQLVCISAVISYLHALILDDSLLAWYDCIHQLSSTVERIESSKLAAFAGLTAYVKAGMGSLIVDTATVSKAALASAASALLRRPTSSSSPPRSPPSQHAPDSPTGAHHNFDLEYMGPAKFAEIRAQRTDWPGYIPSDCCAAPANGQDNLINTNTNTSSVCHPATSMLSNQSGQQTVSGCKSAADADATTPSLCGGVVPEGMCTPTVMTSDGTVVPTHEAARSILESVFVQKGLASPGSPAFNKSLPQLLGMVPEAAKATQATPSASSATPVQGDVDAGGSTAGLARSNAEPSAAATASPAADQEAAVVAHSHAEQGVAGTAGGEPEEQWAGSQAPAQVAATAMAAAAENEAAAQLPPAGSSKQLEESVGAGKQLYHHSEHLCTVLGHAGGNKQHDRCRLHLGPYAGYLMPRLLKIWF